MPLNVFRASLLGQNRLIRVSRKVFRISPQFPYILKDADELGHNDPNL
jgi:hypothetical protein